MEKDLEKLPRNPRAPTPWKAIRKQSPPHPPGRGQLAPHLKRARINFTFFPCLVPP